MKMIPKNNIYNPEMLLDTLNGLTLKLIDDDIIEEWSFSEGLISATMGSINGPVTAPILKFNITGNDSLIIKGLFPIIWDKIEFSQRHVKVNRNSEPAVYEIKEK